MFISVTGLAPAPVITPFNASRCIWWCPANMVAAARTAGVVTRPAAVLYVSTASFSSEAAVRASTRSMSAELAAAVVVGAADPTGAVVGAADVEPAVATGPSAVSLPHAARSAAPRIDAPPILNRSRRFGDGTPRIVALWSELIL